MGYIYVRLNLELVSITTKCFFGKKKNRKKEDFVLSYVDTCTSDAPVSIFFHAVYFRAPLIKMQTFGDCFTTSYVK